MWFGGFCLTKMTNNMNGLTDQEIEFLQQSNYIESEPGSEALDDAVKAWQYIIAKPTLNLGRILQVHTLLMRSRITIENKYKGTLRTAPVWIGNREAPPYYVVPDLVKNFIEMTKGKSSGEPLEVWIKRCHIAFEHAHPFFDGNGRVGRILLNWQRVKAGLPILVIREEDRFEYYKWFSSLA